jgi:3-isopropylmalate/(R)-2-methylmalate dehydratase large subunit
MGMTITEMILAAHVGLGKVEPGDLIDGKIDIAMGNDITIPLAIEELERIGLDRVFDREKIVIIPDHFAPSKDIKSAENCKRIKEFAMRHQIVHYYEVGEMGIEHALLPEKGIVLPGDVVVGEDSHTCTYGDVGAFATGVGSTDLAVAMLTGELWFKVPESMKLVYQGKLQKWVNGKDLLLYTIGDIGVDGALYRAIEFRGETIEELPMSGRLTMANMAIEAEAKNGIFQPDRVTQDYLKEGHSNHTKSSRAIRMPIMLR